ncbi:hypothetical protein FV242_22165 [Methylobacterium sp. WL64]|nr:hypothetical protein FV242_22165 [Methylobacterium sp. WL64]
MDDPGVADVHIGVRFHALLLGSRPTEINPTQSFKGARHHGGIWPKAACPLRRKFVRKYTRGVAQLHAATYGSLGAAIAFMAWIWLSTVVLLGTKLNAGMEHQTVRDTATSGQKPLGARQAHMADTVASA